MKRILLSALLLLLAVPALAQQARTFAYNMIYDTTNVLPNNGGYIWVVPFYYHGGAGNDSTSYRSVATNRKTRSQESPNGRHPGQFVADVVSVVTRKAANLATAGAGMGGTVSNFIGRVRFCFAFTACDTTGMVLSAGDRYEPPARVDSVGFQVIGPDTVGVTISFHGNTKS